MSQRRDRNGRFTSRRVKKATNLFTRAQVLKTLTEDEVLEVIFNQSEADQRILVQTILSHGYESCLLLARDLNKDLWHAGNGHMLDIAKLLVEYGQDDKMATTIINIAQDLLAHEEELKTRTTGEDVDAQSIRSIFGGFPINLGKGFYK